MVPGWSENICPKIRESISLNIVIIQIIVIVRCMTQPATIEFDQCNIFTFSKPAPGTLFDKKSIGMIFGE